MAERHLTVRRRVAASCPSVWAVFADFPNLADHWSGLKASRPIGNQTHGVGARRQVALKPVGALIETVTAWEEGSAIATTNQPSALVPFKQADSRLTLEPDDDGTAITFDYRYVPRGGPIGRLSGLLIDRRLRTDFESMLAAIGEAALTRADRPQGLGLLGPDVAALLGAYDAQLRARVPDVLPDGVRVERDGPLLRWFGFGGRGFVEYRDLGGLDGRELDQLIARQVRIFSARGERFEWKLHGHDRPRDLGERLRVAGLVPEDVETVVIAPVATISVEASPPEGVIVREVCERVDLERIAELESAIWGQDQGVRAEALERERVADPDALTILIAEAGDSVVCAGWVRFPPGTEFATLWGGGTLPDWRGRGIYRALVAQRARLAAQRGRRYLQVDASEQSRPILERLGFVMVTTTTPFVWSPP
jgi:GNAT superfamily N-acetyltransferase